MKADQTVRPRLDKGGGGADEGFEFAKGDTTLAVNEGGGGPVAPGKDVVNDVQGGSVAEVGRLWAGRGGHGKCDLDRTALPGKVAAEFPVMKTRLPFLSLLLIFASSALLPAQDGLPAAPPPYYRVKYEASKVAGELPYAVSYTVWLPPGVKEVRGLIVHQHGCGEGACKAGRTAAYDLHWQALAQKHGCALLGPSYEQPEKESCALWCDPRNGSDKKYLQALDDLAKASGHAELSKVPWALWGHSGGANWAGTMLLLHPERIAAVWLRSGSPRLIAKDGSIAKDGGEGALPVADAALEVPVMCNLGTKEGVTVKDGRFAKVWQTTEPFFTDMRSRGGLTGVAVDPLSSHECGNQRYLAIPWLDACLTARLPEKPGAPLKSARQEDAWLAVFPGEVAVRAADFAGDKTKAVWLPDERTARAWMAYVKNTKVADTTPPPAPTIVKAAPGGVLTWEAVADLESGLAGFVIERDGQEIARLPEKPAGPFGRAIFQTNSYSDTPSEPMPGMTFTDASAPAGTAHVWRVTAVNSAGLKSEPVVAVP